MNKADRKRAGQIAEVAYEAYEQKKLIEVEVILDTILYDRLLVGGWTEIERMKPERGRPFIKVLMGKERN